MKLTIEIKPQVINATTKSKLVQIVNKYKKTQYSVSNVLGITLTNTIESGGNIIITTQFQKKNKKTVQKKRKDSKSEYGKRTVSKIIQEKGWTCNIYTIPLMFLKAKKVKEVKVGYDGKTVYTLADGTKTNHNFVKLK